MRSVPKFLRLGGVAIGLAALADERGAEARPEAPALLCGVYPRARSCAGRLPGCPSCHVTTAPPAWNAYGEALRRALDGGPFAEALPRALRAVEADDSDADGATNADEIALGANPGDPADGGGPPRGPADPGDDAERALRRVSLLYCGRSPSFDRLEAFRALGGAEARRGAVHALLRECLDAPYWRDEGLPRLADRLVRPVYAVGIDSPLGIPLADYGYDYRLFSYALTGGRDARELLTAQYHVERGGSGELVRVEGAIAGTGPLGGGQPLAPERRAGMITTQWFFVINTMFSALPRTTAAQAYRAYLGFDVARQEGLFPVEGEPVDVDRKGVGEAACAACHATLDPLSYAFAYYRGIDLENLGFGTYDEARPGRAMPGWAAPRSVLMGEPVADVVDWARRAADSEAFARTLGLMFFRHAFGREPGPDEAAEFDATWGTLAADGYSADAFLHRLVDLRAFGGGAT